MEINVNEDSIPWSLDRNILKKKYFFKKITDKTKKAFIFNMKI